MILHPPFFIGSNLCPAIKVADATLSFISADYEPSSGRYVCTFELWHPEWVHMESTMRTGVGSCGSIVSLFETFLGFLYACGESMRYLDDETYRDPDSNANLFPWGVAQWAARNCDEISMVGCDISDETGNPLDHLIEETE